MPGTEKLQTDSSADGAASSNDATAVSARRLPNRMIRENVHTNVLGRDAGDSTREVDFGTTTTTTENANNNGKGANFNSANAPAANDKKNGWWGTGIFGGRDEAPLEASNNDNVNRKRRSNNARYDGLQQSLEEGNYDPPPLSGLDSSSSVATDSLATATEATAATREDRVRQDCSYFYRGMDDDLSSPFHRTKSHRKGGRTVTAANSMLRRLSVRARLSGEVDGALFMSRYERLNQVMDPPKRKSKNRHRRGQQYNGNDNSNSNHSNEDSNHELFLDENVNDQQPSSYREHIPSPTNNIVMGATSLANPHGVRSSMFFEQDGKMLMRLPRDQVRLVMDYNLEPGIISVEQWRSQEDAEAASEKLAVQNSKTKLSVQRERERGRKHRRQERERHRRRRRQRRKHRKQKISETDAVQDGDGKLPLETVPLEERKGRDVEEPNEDRIVDDNDDDHDDDSYSSYSNDDDSYFSDDDNDSLNQDLLPKLKYVITIPDDLYRRMVAEMSAEAFPPYWGFFKCCHQESERADIKLALAILSVVMFLLFIGSLEWRTT